MISKKIFLREKSEKKIVAEMTKDFQTQLDTSPGFGVLLLHKIFFAPEQHKTTCWAKTRERDEKCVYGRVRMRVCLYMCVLVYVCSEEIE